MNVPAFCSSRLARSLSSFSSRSKFQPCVDGQNLRCAFRCCVDLRAYHLWEEVVSIASTASLTEDDDEMVWQFHSSGNAALCHRSNSPPVNLVAVNNVIKLRYICKTDTQREK
jgi:hypothetical protein